MTKEGSKACIVFAQMLSVALMILVVVFLFLPRVYALNKDYVISEYNEWIDIDDKLDFNRNNDGFDGILKYIVDDENGCFYAYFSFYDTRISGSSDDSIILSFKVENDVNSYAFSVNRNGFIDTGNDSVDAINLIYNFDGCSCSGAGGEILVGFELKCNADRALKNRISCDYSAGIEKTTPLFSNVILDMYVEPTAVQTTVKNVVTTKGKGNSDKTSKADKTKQNTEKTTKITTTKYTPTGTIKSATKAKVTKYSGGKYETNEGFVSGETESDEAVTSEQGASSDELEVSGNGHFKMSKMSVVLIIVSAILVLAAIVILTVCMTDKVLGRKRKNDEEQDKPE